MTHRAGQYVPEGSWPTICGPAASSSPGKNCNVFHGDHTGLQVGPDDGVHITWTGLNREVTSPQVDPLHRRAARGVRAGSHVRQAVGCPKRAACGEPTSQAPPDGSDLEEAWKAFLDQTEAGMATNEQRHG